MAIYQVKTFDDICDAVREELKIQSGDATSIIRIKRNVNAVYLHEVIPFKRWPWLLTSTDVQLAPYTSTGTASVTLNSTTVTLSSAPAASKAGQWFSVDGQSKRYLIASHTAATTTVTLTARFEGATDTAAAFKIWSDTIALPTNCRETVEVTQDGFVDPVTPMGLQQFRRTVNRSPKLESDIITAYHTLIDETGSPTRELLVYPSITDAYQTLHVDYIKSADPLENDSDEPLIPEQDRMILVYGACAASWVRERNEATADRNQALYLQKLARMAGKHEDTKDHPILQPSASYLASKRRGTRRRRNSWNEDD